MPPLTPNIDQQQKKKKLIIIGVITGAVVLFLGLLFSNNPLGAVRVEIITVPSDAALTIDGKPSKTGWITLTKGKHTLKATRELFGPATKEIDTETLPPGKPIYLPLDGRSEAALKYIESHPKERELAERAAGALVTERQEALLDSYPVINELPYETTDYLIDYTIKKDHTLAFTITLFPLATMPGTPEYKQQLEEYRTAALAFLRQNGVNTSGADIAVTPNPDEQ